MIDYSLIKQMFKLQDEFNEYTTKDWRRADLAWRRAIWLECAEAVESLDWKWWKHKEPDLDNLKVEMVDIWHFIMSYMWTHKKAIAERPEDFDYLFTIKEHDVDLITMIEDLAALALEKPNPDQKFIVYIFVNIWSKMGYQINDLYREYVIKNVLNKVRQDRGYKTGTYIKNWTTSEGVVEDNVVAWNLASTVETDDKMFETMYSNLIEFYDNMTK